MIEPFSGLEHLSSHAIDLTEAAYDIEKPDSTWLPDLIEAGAPVLDQGLGVFGFDFVRPPPGGGGGDFLIRNMHLSSVPADFPKRFHAARSLLSPEFAQALTRAGYAGTWTEIGKDYPEEAGPCLEKLGYSDMLIVSAADPNGGGVKISAPLSKATKLTPRSRERWHMLGAHIASAYRLRRALAETGGRSQVEPTGLPRDAEAVFDAKGFRMVDSVGRAKEADAVDVLREAARSVDRARGKLRKDDPQQALETWKALVSGRWSIVDWFDTDGRRFILAMSNRPEARDPRGLTEQESQVVMYVMLAETSKLIAYRLGLSTSRVSALLKSAMYKLSVNSRAELVQKLSPLGVPAAAKTISLTK